MLPATAPPPQRAGGCDRPEGAKSVAAGMNPMDLKRGIDLAWTPWSPTRQELQEGHLERGNAQVGTISSMATPKSANSSPTHEEGRQRGRHHG